MDFSHESAALSRSSCSAISSFTSAHSDGGNSSCSNVTNTASNSANVSSPLLYAGPGAAASSSLQLSRHCVRSASEFEGAAADTRLLKLARLDQPFSQHAALEPHIMNHNSSSSSFMYLDNNNPSSISNNNSARSPFVLPAAASAQAAFPARAQGSLPNLGPTRSLFTPEQWAEFTQQTYVFKHLAAGVTPPPALLLSIINNVASLGRMGAGSIHNAGGFYSGLRGNADLEPGRCRRTDGKKWRCAREVVPDQKYCERHLHRGRHRSRAKVMGAISTNEPLNASPKPAQSAPNVACTLEGNAKSIGLVINPSAPLSGVTGQSSSPGLSRESQLHFSLQPAVGLSSNEDSRSVANDNHDLLSDPSLGLRRIIENSPNLAELVKANSSTTTSTSTTKLFNNLPTTTTKSQMNMESLVKAERAASQPAFPFNFLTSDRDADNLALRQFIGDWPKSVPRESGVPPILSWLDQLAEEQNKRSRSNSDLSINTRLKQSPSPLSLSMAKLGGEEDMAAADPSHCMGLSMAVGAEVSKDEGRYRSSNWVPITWDSPTIGGPLAEVLQSNNSIVNTNTNANRDQSCLNLIEESWDHHASPTKLKSHSPSLASPTGVLQIKTAFGSYSDSSSSASSPRSALKLDPAAHHCDTLSQANLAN